MSLYVLPPGGGSGGGYVATPADPDNSAAEIAMTKAAQETAVKSAGGGGGGRGSGGKGKRKMIGSGSAASPGGGAGSPGGGENQLTRHGVDFSSYDVADDDGDSARLTVATVAPNPSRPFQCPECRKCKKKKNFFFFFHKLTVHDIICDLFVFDSTFLTYLSLFSFFFFLSQ